MTYQELEALLASLARLLLDGRIAVLMLLLISAAICDTRTHRIPNRLVLWGGLFGVICTTIWPPVHHGTILFPLAGLVVGLLLFFPLYLLRAMGAGDVKLLAMVGTFLGPLDTFYAALASTIAGGVLSILWVLWHGKTLRLVQNLTALLPLELGAVGGSSSGLRIEPSASAGKLPYGVAIAVGTISCLVFHQLGFF
jgi:prepilin peptidase CpaA